MSLQAVIADRILELDSSDNATAFAVRLRNASADQLPALVAALGGLPEAADEVILPLLLEIAPSVRSVTAGRSMAALTERLNDLEEEEAGLGSHLWDVLGAKKTPVLAYHHDCHDTAVLVEEGTALLTWNDQTNRWELRLADLDDLGTLRETSRL